MNSQFSSSLSQITRVCDTSSADLILAIISLTAPDSNWATSPKTTSLIMSMTPTAFISLEHNFYQYDGDFRQAGALGEELELLQKGCRTGAGRQSEYSRGALLLKTDIESVHMWHVISTAHHGKRCLHQARPRQPESVKFALIEGDRGAKMRRDLAPWPGPWPRPWSKSERRPKQSKIRVPFGRERLLLLQKETLCLIGNSRRGLQSD